MTTKFNHLASAAAAIVAMAAIDAAKTEAAAQDDCFIGEIRQFGGTFAPRGWALTDGSLLAVSQFDALFSILGTTYGGDGRTTFALPDLRGRIPIGAGAGPGLSSYRLGQKVGAQTAVLTASTNPSHTHAAATDATLKATTTLANASSPVGALLADEQGENIYNSGTNLVDMDASAVASSTTLSTTGASAGYGIEQPSTVTNYIICIAGIYPSRN
ncbi:MAG: tail fiber protein [Pseudomonadota bacterium]